MLLLLGMGNGCAREEREQATRRAVKSLVAAPEEYVAGERRRVVAFGRYALPDIEQEFHSADPGGRVRLLEALERLAQEESLPFLKLVARWDEDDAVRKRAAKVVATLDHR
jgi:hypothetical protein